MSTFDKGAEQTDSLGSQFPQSGFDALQSCKDFVLGLNWAPSFSGRGGSSDLGVIPLLWGTFYISIVALAVAIPVALGSLYGLIPAFFLTIALIARTVFEDRILHRELEGYTE